MAPPAAHVHEAPGACPGALPTHGRHRVQPRIEAAAVGPSQEGPLKESPMSLWSPLMSPYFKVAKTKKYKKSSSKHLRRHSKCKVRCHCLGSSPSSRPGKVYAHRKHHSEMSDLASWNIFKSSLSKLHSRKPFLNLLLMVSWHKQLSLHMFALANSKLNPLTWTCTTDATRQTAKLFVSSGFTSKFT